jgi:tetratricopeptide (TPR) repeat protein
MIRLTRSARPRRAALALVCCLAAGCATGPPARLDAPLQGQVATRPLQDTPPVVTLDGAAERRARALAHYGTAISLQEQDNVAGAIEQYMLALEIEPENVPLAVRMGRLFMGRREASRAVHVLENTARASPGAAEAWHWLGIAHKFSGEPAPAIAAWRQALKLDPSSFASLQALVETLLREDQVEEAGRALETAWHQKVEDAGYWMRLGDLYASAVKQKPDLARRITEKRIQESYARALKYSSDDIEVLVRMVELYEAEQETAKAVEIYRRLLRVRPDDAALRMKLALAYAELEEKQKAVAVLQELIRGQPLRFDAYNLLGELYEELEDFDRAIATYQQSLVLNPDQVPAYWRIALLQLRQKKPDEALATLDRAQSRLPRTFQLPYFRGVVRLELKEYDKALAHFTEAEQLARETGEESRLDSYFYFYYGSAAERTGDIERASPLFQKAIELNPENHSAYNYLGYMWADKGVHLEEAHELIQKAVEMDPDNGAYIDSLGWVLYRLGHPEEALPHLRRAAELITDDAVVFDHLAEVLIKLGRPDEALIYLRKAHELEPDNKEISDKLEQLTGSRTAIP